MKIFKQKKVMRNPLHDHPLMKRGGVHEKSKKAQRQQDRVQLKKLWRYLRAGTMLLLNNTTGKGKNDGRQWGRPPIEICLQAGGVMLWTGNSQ